MSDSAAAFGWYRWPFGIVADEGSARIWADRRDLGRELDRRLRKLRTVGHSTVQLMWADFGVGKTHTLRRIEALCQGAPDTAFIPVYTETPVETTGFLDLYRRFVAALPDDEVDECSGLLRAGLGRSVVSQGARDLRHALRLLHSDDADGRSIAFEWLQAVKGLPHLRLLRSYGISARIEDDARAVEVLSELLGFLVAPHRARSIVWLVDEFQRVADIPHRKRDAFGKSLVSLFNACPNGLHLVLSFSVAQQATATAMMPPDLQSRAATFPVLALKRLSREDCTLFAMDLFQQSRASDTYDACYPFTEGGLLAVVDSVCETSGGDTTPRVLMERLESVLFELLEREDPSASVPIDEATARNLIETVLSRG